jgi:dihydrofolate reductase
MSSLVLAMFVSLDGYIEGPNGEFFPPPWSAEVSSAWANHNLKNAAHLLYGRVNFNFNKEYWTSPAAVGQAETEAMNQLPKTVVSTTLSGDPGWNGMLAGSDLTETVQELKAKVSAGDIYCFGGAGIAKSLMTHDLIDEFYLMLIPHLLGGGKRLFEPGIPKMDLTLMRVTALDVGSVILQYAKNRNAKSDIAAIH